jgi:hypothetical protein
LVHGSGGDDAMIIGDSFESLKLAGCEFHRILQKISDKCRATPILNQKRAPGVRC